jgi:hypothetical protein
MSWRLRKADQTLYGPAEWNDLLRWAAEGRIFPGDEVAEADGPWRPAIDAAGLGLDWIAQLPGDKALGPLHLLAFLELIRDRVLTGDEPLVHRATGERRTLAAVLLPELLKQLDAARAAYEELQAAGPLVRAAPEPQPAAPAPAPAPEPKPAAPAPSAPLSAIREKEFHDLSMRNDRLLARVRELEEELAEAKRQPETPAQEKPAELETLQAAHDAALVEIARLMQQLKDAEADHAALTRSFRDLNERYILLRSAGAPIPPPAPTASPPPKPKVRLI